MQSVKTMFVGAALFAGVAAFPAYAIPLTGQSNPNENQGVEQVAVKCGPHAHYVKAHHTKDGHHVLGHCVYDHPHH